MSSSEAAAASAEPIDGNWTLVIDAARSAQWLDWREVWRYRELIWILAERHQGSVSAGHRRHGVGGLQPVVQMLVFSGLFALLGKRPSGGQVPYGASVFCGLLLWQLFASIVSTATSCLVDNRQLLTKVYFPRVVLPLSACIRPLVDFGVGCVVLVVLMAWHQIPPSPALLALPVLVLLTLIAASALGLWLSALNAHYRDFGYIVPFALQMGFFISPVIYETASLIPERWRWLHGLNPMASLLDAFRWSAIGTPPPSLVEMSMSTLTTVFVLATGVWYFRRVERFLADHI